MRGHGRSSIPGLLVGVGLLLAGVAAAQEKPAAEKGKGAPPPDQQAAMEAMKRAAMPGDAHRKLEPLVGNFDVKVKMWMDPSKPPEESTGTSENKWVLGDRYVQMSYQGTFMGQPFSGIGYTGYDNTTKKYIGTWMDTASTAMMVSKGSMNGKVLKTTSSMADPLTGKMMTLTDTLTIADNDHHTMEMWGPGPDGKNAKMMEIAYTRKK
jgi:Protein of unknown function (DUF1579)